jgi:ketosteroid isomerase-like protein
MKSKIFLLFAITILFTFTVFAAKKTAIQNPQSETQKDAWNKGNLEEFMKGYWRSDKLTFFSGGGKRAGYDAVIERYRKTYQSEGKEMGKLTFSQIEVEMIGKKAAFVRGRFDLVLSDGKKLGGLYTLIFRQFNDGWKIIHDHSSSD